ncbi:HXXEE domain-containing protein [Microbacterium sp. NPDC090014]|uniref:HXXEE domain-containing protein n=1 Tax=Microbacterium sp. NPDC090014 TaxID=3364205 RepID=UPI00382FC1D7
MTMKFLARYNLYIFTAIGLAIGIYTLIAWPSMPVLQRATGLMSLAVVLHLWEEGRFPGGFTDLIANKLNFTAKSRHFGEIVTGILVIVVLFIPFFFPQIVFMQVAALYLGFLEAFAHVAAIGIFRLKKPYSPGMLTAVVLMLPIAITGIVIGSQQGLIDGLDYLWAGLYLILALAIAQFTVVRSSGMPYSEFLGNIAKNIKGTPPTVQ